MEKVLKSGVNPVKKLKTCCVGYEDDPHLADCPNKGIDPRAILREPYKSFLCGACEKPLHPGVDCAGNPPIKVPCCDRAAWSGAPHRRDCPVGGIASEKPNWASGDFNGCKSCGRDVGEVHTPGCCWMSGTVISKAVEEYKERVRIKIAYFKCCGGEVPEHFRNCDREVRYDRDEKRTYFTCCAGEIPRHAQWCDGGQATVEDVKRACLKAIAEISRSLAHLAEACRPNERRPSGK